MSITLSTNNIPYGYCHCGCGQKTNIAKQNERRRGHLKGEPMPYIQTHPASQGKGEKNYNWKGGHRYDKDGYILILMHEHPTADSKGYIREHILIAERVLGKSLPPKAKMHHGNENRSDNLHSNLIVCENNTYHMLLHMRIRALRVSGHADWRKCKFCKTYDNPRKMYVPLNGSASHRQCRNKYEIERRQLWISHR